MRWNEWFVMPTEVNGKGGYVLSVHEEIELGWRVGLKDAGGISKLEQLLVRKAK